jgi:hypothetical protein
LPFLKRSLRNRLKKVRTTHFSFVFCRFFALWRSNFFKHCEIQTKQKRKSPWKKHQIGRERPHFFGFQPPKKCVGSLPPCGTVKRAGRFLHGDKEFGRDTHHQRRNSMPLVKKAPGIMTREIRLEVPVNELLEDYSRFIESNADHVINAVLKKVLWRDQDYRKWREARRTAQSGTDKAQTTEARARA